MRRAVLLALLAALVAAADAQGARRPTLKEREALTALMPPLVRSFPAECEWLEMKVSSNGRWAEVTPTFLNATQQPCLRYAERAGNGYYIVEKTSDRWHIVLRGSDPPPCGLHVPRDISGECAVCHGTFCTYRRSGA